MLHRPTRLALLRVWLIDHSDGVGLLGIMSVGALLGLIVVTFSYYPLGPVEHTTGTIVRLGAWANSTGRATAFVEVDQQRIQVRLPMVNSCVVGGSIRLLKQRRFWGQSVIPDWLPCGRTL
jgi:hypothetical protein